MKTILVVSYHFPPEESSCSEKNVRIVKLLLDHGFNIVVLTKPGTTVPWESANLKIVRTDRTGIFHKSSIVAGCSSTSIGTQTRSSKFKRFLSYFILPDGTIDWMWEGKRFFKSHKSTFNGVDLVLSISSPYSAHILSEYISRKLGVPYIMSYGDPWIYEPKRKRGRIRYNIEFMIEKRLISKSAGILVITKYNKEKYKKLYNIHEGKIRTFHIGFDKSDIHEVPELHNNSFNIIYGGSLNPVHRDPEPFIKALRKIKGVNVSIFNNDSETLPEMIQQYSVTKSVHLFPIVKASEFLTEMYKNDALLLFGNRTPFQVPGKVFTYIATGKTIIYLKNNVFSYDGTEEVLREYGNSVILNNDEEGIVIGLNDFLSTRSSKLPVINRDIFEFHYTMLPIVEMIKDVLRVHK